MSAIPIVPGLMYQVRHNGQVKVVFARNPVDAICIALEQLGAI
jgi:hypothetical protein